MPQPVLKIARTVQQLQEEVATVLADGGFADKRTELEQWEAVLRQARVRTALLDKAHAKLKQLGFEPGVLGLL